MIGDSDNGTEPHLHADASDPSVASDRFPGHDEAEAVAVAAAVDRDPDMSPEDEEDVPLGVQITDALAMLAEGGHHYPATPLAAEEPITELGGDEDETTVPV